MEVGRSFDVIDQKVKKLNDTIKLATNQTRELDKSLKLDPKNTEASVAKMKLLENQVGLTTQKVALLKQKQIEANQMFAKGDISAKEYNKIQVSVSWLMSLAAIVKAGGTIPDALRLLADNANRYLRSILDNTLHYIANGDNLGVALTNTGRNFPDDEIIGDLIIYADMNGFDENLNKIANDYLEESVRKMERVSNILNSIGILIVSAIIAWVVLGTFQMQDQITAALG